MLAPTPAARADAQAAATGWDAGAEYDEILALVRGGGAPRAQPAGVVAPEPGAAYQGLMAKERRVLDTVDRVVNDAARLEEEDPPLARLRLHELLVRSTGALRGLMDDLLEAAEARSAPQALAALTDPGRRVFLGVCLLALGILLAVVQAAAA